MTGSGGATPSPSPSLSIAQAGAELEILLPDRFLLATGEEEVQAEVSPLSVLAAKCSHRERAFAEAYVGPARFNSSRAAVMVGYSDSQWIRATAAKIKHRPAVMAYIQALLAAASPPPEAILAELADVAFSEFRDHIEITRDQRTGEVVRVKMDLRSKVEALHILAKARKLLVDRVEQEVHGEVLVREYPEGI